MSKDNGLYMKKETCGKVKMVYLDTIQKRPKCVKRDLLVCGKRDLRKGKKVVEEIGFDTCQKRPMHVKRELFIFEKIDLRKKDRW